MRISKYVNVDKNILIEYIYDDGNLIGESYKIGVNIKNKKNNYLSSDSSSTTNTSSNTLFPIDLVKNTFGKFDTTSYSFLQTKDFSSGFPIRYDIIKIHLPINYTFGEYLGFYLRVYAFDKNQSRTYDISNFYYDISDISQSNIFGYTNPPLYFKEKLWGKSITIEVPSVFAISGQSVSGVPKANTINFNLTDGVGLSSEAPIFLDFHFISNKSTINTLTTYTLTSKNTLSIPQAPEFEKIGVRVEESINGDFFEIYGIYNDNIGEFNDFINRSVYSGNRYYVEYNIIMYEQNIRGKSMKVISTDDFLSKVEFRPIIKYSTTTAIIDVEMNLIDTVDGSQITRRASYGMLQDQVSKYSLRLMKINLSNSNKPKIYNLKSNNTTISSGSNNLVVETIKVSYPVLIDRWNVVAKSDNVVVNKGVFFGIGKLMITLYPFDNIIKFTIASQIEDNKINYLDATNLGEIKMFVKNQNTSVEMPLYLESGDIDLSRGLMVFKLVSSKINDVRRIYESGINVFYITSTHQLTTSVIYSGLYKIYDSSNNVIELNQVQSEIVEVPALEVSDEEIYSDAIVTKREIFTSSIDVDAE